MADNNKQNPDAADDDFDFAEADWGADDDAAFGAPEKAAEDPFGDGAFDDPAVFAPDKDATASAEDPFAADDDEGFVPAGFGDDDDDFEFQDMPTPGSVAEKAGDPDEEFGDLDSDSFATADGFDDGKDLFDEDEPAADGVSDPFEEDVQTVEEFHDQEDPFNGSDDDVMEMPADADASTPKGKSKLVFPLAVAAVVGVVGIAGYTVVMPMLQSPTNETVAVNESVSPAPQFPVGLPGEEGGLPLPAPIVAPEIAAPTDMATEIPALDIPQFDPAPEASDDVALPSFDMPAPVEEDGLQGQTVTEGPFGDSEPAVGIEAMRTPEPAPASIDQDAVEDLNTRMTSIEDRFETLIERVDGIAATLESRQAALPSSVGQAPAEPLPLEPVTVTDLRSLTPPLKPLVIENTTLKGVTRDQAWISTPSGVVEVSSGDTIPGGGRLVSIIQHHGNWIVVTTDGIIVQ